MNVLLDTSVFLWVIGGHQAKLSPAAWQAVRDEDNRLLLSAASLWEIALKVRSGKLKLPETREFLKEHLRRLGIDSVLAVEAVHVFRVFELPDHHRDPFDRLLVAQCQVENVPLVTSDSTINKYAIDVIW